MDPREGLTTSYANDDNHQGAPEQPLHLLTVLLRRA